MNNLRYRITRREAEHKETWRAVDDSILEELKKDPVSKWGFGAGELVQTAKKMIKVLGVFTFALTGKSLLSS